MLRPFAFTAAAALGFGSLVCTCKEEAHSQGAPPPPPAPASALTAVCAGGGGKISDEISAPFFPPTVAGYCLDPHGDEKTYGDHAKLKIDELCTTALDGGCEEYKRFGVTRSAIVHYVQNDGSGTVEVFVSQFAADGAYAIYTTRLTGESDPADEHGARVLPIANALGALGTGKAYAERGPYFVELTYTNDQETPAQLKKSSDSILTALAKEIAAHLPSTPEIPAAAKALPEAERIPNGVMYFPKDVLGVKGGGAGAIGYYKTSTGKRYRVVSIVRETQDQAKDFIHSLRMMPGAMPVANLGDAAVQVVLQASPERPKIEWIVGEKGASVMGVGDEEFSAEDPKTKLSKDDKIEKDRSLLK